MGRGLGSLFPPVEKLQKSLSHPRYHLTSFQEAICLQKHHLVGVSQMWLFSWYLNFTVYRVG